MILTGDQSGITAGAKSRTKIGEKSQFSEFDERLMEKMLTRMLRENASFHKDEGSYGASYHHSKHPKCVLDQLVAIS